MISNNILSELNSDEYKNKFYYQIGEIITKITENLKLIDEKTYIHMNGHLNTLLSHINSSFILQINIEGINDFIFNC